MLVIILAGGYARRLWPLTKTKPKPLLPVGGRLIIDYIMDKVDALGTRVTDRYVLTNRTFEDGFRAWAENRRDITIIQDGSTNEENKIGAVGALGSAVDKINDEFMVLAGDCLFLDELSPMVSMYDEKRDPVVALYHPRSKEQLLRGSAVSLDDRGCIVEYIEKPQKVVSDLVGAVIYLFPEDIRSRLLAYLQLGLPRDEPGRFIEWLHKRERVYGYLLPHDVWDIGTPEAYATALSYLEKLS